MSAEQVANTATGFISQEGGWFPYIQNVIAGGIVFQLYANVVDGIDGLGFIVFGPIRALGEGTILLISATFGAVISVFDAGTQATVLSFTEGVGAFLGPFAQPTAVGVGMLSIGVFLFAASRLRFSPTAFLAARRGR